MAKTTEQESEQPFGYPHVLEGMSLDGEYWTVSIERDYSWQWSVYLDYDVGTDLHTKRIEDITLRIISDAANGQFLAMIPRVNCLRKPTPQRTDDVVPPQDPQDYILDTQREVIVFLRQNLGNGVSLTDWLADWINRHHWEAMIDTVGGVGKVGAQDLYEQYGRVENFVNQDEETIKNKHRFVERKEWRINDIKCVDWYDHPYEDNDDDE